MQVDTHTSECVGSKSAHTRVNTWTRFLTKYMVYVPMGNIYVYASVCAYVYVFVHIVYLCVCLFMSVLFS